MRSFCYDRQKQWKRPLPGTVAAASIARAVVAQPSLLLLDEITANLDAETEKMVLQALRRAAEHRTVISVSHRTSAELGRTSGEYSIGGSYNLVQGNSRL